MKIELNWFESIQLGNATTIRDNTRVDQFDFSQIPEISGVYIFYRYYNNKETPLYIGKSINIRKRMKQHFKNIDLLEELQNSKRGSKHLIFAEVKTRNSSKLSLAIDQAEKGLIQYYKDHDLLNKRFMEDHFDEITSTGCLIKLVDIETKVYNPQK